MHAVMRPHDATPGRVRMATRERQGAMSLYLWGIHTHDPSWDIRGSNEYRRIIFGAEITQWKPSGNPAGTQREPDGNPVGTGWVPSGNPAATGWKPDGKLTQ